MNATREIRATFSDDHVLVYQAYGHEIAQATLAAGRFAGPFSRSRMTWIKPSLLWAETFYRTWPSSHSTLRWRTVSARSYRKGSDDGLHRDRG